MSVAATVVGNFNVVETIESSSSPAATSNLALTLNGYNDSTAYTATSTPPVDTVVDESRTLAAGTETVDLTAAKLAREVSLTTDCTGKKVVAVKIRASSANDAGGLTIADGATNGYNLFGDASGQVTLLPGQSLQFSFDVTSPLDAVGASDAEIDITGTIGDQLDLLILLG